MVENKETVEIIVNGREKVVHLEMLSSDGELSFAQVIRLAFDPVPSNPNIIFHVLYSNGAERPPSGRLAEGGSVKVQDGTVFNVSTTDKS